MRIPNLVKRLGVGLPAIMNWHLLFCCQFAIAECCAWAISPHEWFSASTRRPIPTDKLRVIQKACQTTDDEPRWLVALISDTGMRLSEAAGLAREDIVLDADIPHVIIRPHPWRRLKTKGSERTLPLVGASLWAAERAVEASHHSPLPLPSLLQ